VAAHRHRELCLDKPDSYHRDSTGHLDNIHARQNADNGDGRKFRNCVVLGRRGNDPELIFHFLCVDADQSSADPHHFFFVVAAQTVSARVAGRVDADQSVEVRCVFLVVADQTVSARVVDRVDASQSSEVRHVFLVVADQTVSARVVDRVDAGQIHFA
jgi:hypothetical protein